MIGSSIGSEDIPVTGFDQPEAEVDIITGDAESLLIKPADRLVDLLAAHHHRTCERRHVLNHVQPIKVTTCGSGAVLV